MSVMKDKDSSENMSTIISVNANANTNANINVNANVNAIINTNANVFADENANANANISTNIDTNKDMDNCVDIDLDKSDYKDLEKSMNNTLGDCSNCSDDSFAVGGFHKNSFVDFKGKISSVVFTKGCNFNCYYCHNKGLINNNTDYNCKEMISKERAEELILSRKKYIDGVVITGGEPTLQPGLPYFLESVKKMGLPVKLDTNGTNPEMLNMLYKTGLLDYIAMDIKAPFEKYDSICGTKVNITNIEKSINLIMNGNVRYEFRTTVVPELDREDIMKIAEIIRGARAFYLQQYRVVNLVGKPHSPGFFHEMSHRIANIVENPGIRGA